MCLQTTELSYTDCQQEFRVPIPTKAGTREQVAQRLCPGPRNFDRLLPAKRYGRNTSHQVNLSGLRSSQETIIYLLGSEYRQSHPFLQANTHQRRFAVGARNAVVELLRKNLALRRGSLGPCQRASLRDPINCSSRPAKVRCARHSQSINFPAPTDLQLDRPQPTPKRTGCLFEASAIGGAFSVYI